MTEEESKKYNQKLMAKFPDKKDLMLKRPGDPQPHRLPSVYFTSLEVIFMSKLVGWFVSECEFMPVQGIHDGFLFITTREKLNTPCVKDVEAKLEQLSLEVLGLKLNLSTTEILDENSWVQFYDKEELSSEESSSEDCVEDS